MRAVLLLGLALALFLFSLVLLVHVRVGVGLETTGALLGCESSCERFFFLALCTCAWACALRRRVPCWGMCWGAIASPMGVPLGLP